MRRWLALAVVTLTAGTARAEDPPQAPAAAPAAPTPPRVSPEQAADAVLAARKAKDDAALEALAAKDDPDPWLVADELIRRGAHDAAEAFAKAAPRVDVEKLPDYVAARRGRPDDAEGRKALAAASAALGAREARKALDALETLELGSLLDVVGIRRAFGRGLALAALGRSEDGGAAHLAAADAAERVGWLARASSALNEAGWAAADRSALDAALAAWERMRALCERRSDAAGEAHAFSRLGAVHYDRGAFDEAMAMFERALALEEARGNAKGAATALGNIGAVHNGRGEFSKALGMHERALAKLEALGSGQGSAMLLCSIGTDLASLGDYTNALAKFERALAIQEAGGDERGAAETLGNMGVLYSNRGEYAKALAVAERALAAFEALGERMWAAWVLDGIGRDHLTLGDPVQATACYTRALEAQLATGDRPFATRTLDHIGELQLERGDTASALASFERNLGWKEALGDQRGVAKTLSDIGQVYATSGDGAKALAMFERSLAMLERLGERVYVAETVARMGNVHRMLGDDAKALAAYRRALGAAESLGDMGGAAEVLARIGQVLEARGDARGALDAARRGVRLLPQMVAGLGDDQGVSARAHHAELFDLGVRAAASTNDVVAMSSFLEAGRAGSLLESLGARKALAFGLLPPALLAAEAEARAKEARVAAAYRAALERKDLRATRARGQEMDAAREAVASVLTRIQREAKAAARILYPESSPLEAIQRTLTAEDALVLYAMSETQALALVVTAQTSRGVSLGPPSAIRAACEAFHPTEAGEDPGPTVEALRREVVAPLALPEGARRVLLSPEGILTDVPFALLMPGREIAYVPSGTTYGVLREEGRARGEGVLALGDPDYETRVDERAVGLARRGAVGRLVRLPATADEAKAVGDLALLGRGATERGLREAVATRPRWRAVHFACHGLIDGERPAFSSLALTADGDDDGFLNTLEIFRSKIPADLVVLSACETAKGKVVKGEGIMGLTRAFMFAGAPRVICSLWKVDDEATRALMTEFYRLWNPKDGTPGLPTAEALRKAQAFVRDDPKHPAWKHPYYWAAWVLWGLPQ